MPKAGFEPSCRISYEGFKALASGNIREHLVSPHIIVSFSIEGRENIKYFHRDLPLYVVRVGKDRKDFKEVIASTLNGMLLPKNGWIT